MQPRLFLIYMALLSLAAILTVSQVLPAASAFAAKPVVHAVLFFSPTCGHCHKVMTVDLPPLKEKYSSQLDILEIDATQEDGQVLYLAAITKFQVSREHSGVPALYVGDIYLVGDVEIPEKLPGIIDVDLRSGGIAWPDIPGLEGYRRTHRPQSGEEGAGSAFLERFRNDPLANSIAVIVLIGMVASVVAVGVVFLRSSENVSTRSFPEWVVPALCILGLFVAGYMSYVELFNQTALCGPIGNCNTVQQSPYAKLWGILPVGILGIFGYLAILVAWLVKRFGTPPISKYAALAVWAMALLGTLFSIYLTFLEPFVIGTACAWCITNAILITLLMLATTYPAVSAAAQMGEEEG